MDVLTKLRTRVSTALPGNPVTREYELGKSIGFAGPGMSWKLFSAKKRSTQQEATVWEFDKKFLESCSKASKESMLESLRNGVAALTRIKHPKILSVVHPMEESRDSLAFVTEPLFSSLKFTLLQSHSQIQKHSGENTFVLKDVEIKYGLMQISEALNFLHSDCHRVHLNLVPEAIVINKFGLWKLAGLEFSKMLENQSSSSLKPSVCVPFWESSVVPCCQPALTFSSPEALLQGRVTSASDIFSLGLLICCLFNQGEALFDNENDVAFYKRAVKDIASIFPTKIAALPETLREYVRLMFSFDPELRPTALQFLRIPYFEDAAMSVLCSIDNIYQLDNLARSQFYKSLPSTIQSLPKRLCLFRVYPQITEDFSNPHMVPFILPVVLQIMEMVTQEEFVRYMLPRLLPVFSLKEPVQIILLLLQNLHILSAKFPVNEFRTHILPILHSALDIDNRMIQELCLNAIPQISQTVELAVLKNAVLPRVEKLFSRSEVPSIRLGCLICIGKLLDHLDKWIVMDDVLAFVQKIRSREPAILMVILAIYRIAFSHERLGITCEHLATRVLPHLIPLSIESSLNLKQYAAYAELIRDMCARLEHDQRSKLEQLHGVSDDSTLIGFGSNAPKEWISTNSCSDLIDQIMRTYVDPETRAISSYVGSSGFNLASKTTGSLHMSTDVTDRPAELTLEQKRKLAADRAQQNRLQNQLLSNESLTKKESLAPKTDNDLASVYINSNIEALGRYIPTSSSSIAGGVSPTQSHPYMNHTTSLNLPGTSVGIFRNQQSFPVVSLANIPGTIPSIPTLKPVPLLLGSVSSTSSSNFRPLSKNEIDEFLK